MAAFTAENCRDRRAEESNLACPVPEIVKDLTHEEG